MKKLINKLPPRSLKRGISITIMLLITLPIMGFYLGIQYSRKNISPTITKLNQCLNDQLQSEKELNLCIDNSAEIIDIHNTKYNFKSFGLYSPLFQDLPVQNTIYSYRGHKIINKNLETTIDNVRVGISAWEYVGINSNNSEDTKYVIFSGYENYGMHPTEISTEPQPTNKIYQNKSKIKMIWSYDHCPKPICRVNLSFFTPFNPNNHPAYYRLWIDNTDYPISFELDSPKDKDLKEKLMKFADQIEDYSTYH